MAHGHPQPDHVPGAKHEAVPLDPERDIDARSATLWFVGGAFVVFACLWLMVPIFMRVVDAERMHKVDKAPTTELNEAKVVELQFLDGANPKKQKIQDVVTKLRK